MNEFTVHEALHVASIATAFVDEHLCGHDAVKSRPEWQALAEKARDALQELYQAIGREHL